MKYRTAIAALAIAAATPGLAGCNTIGETGSSEETSEAAYLAGLDRGGVPHVDNAQSIAIGRDVCAKFDTGADFISVGLLTAVSTDLTPEQVGYLIGTAVVVFCPGHVSRIEADTGQL